METSSRVSGTDGDDAITQSIVMRSKSGTVRVIDAVHRRNKLAQYSTIEY